MRVTFDTPTNSLVVVSSLEDYQSLRRVIQKLDAPRKQVFIEAMILEVSLDKSRDARDLVPRRRQPIALGTEQGRFDGARRLRRQQDPEPGQPDLRSDAGSPAAVFGPAARAATSRIFGVTTDIPSFGVLRAGRCRRTTTSTCCRSPHLLTTEQREGESRSARTCRSRAPLAGRLRRRLGAAAAPGWLGLSTSVQRQDVALKMKLTPHVNEHDLVRLEIDNEISGRGVEPTSTASARPPPSARSRRRWSSAISRRSCIGGLMKDRVTREGRQDPAPRRHPVPRLPFSNTYEDDEEAEPPHHPHAVHHQGPGRSAARRRAARCASAASSSSASRAEDVTSWTRPRSTTAASAACSRRSTARRMRGGRRGGRAARSLRERRSRSDRARRPIAAGRRRARSAPEAPASRRRPTRKVIDAASWRLGDRADARRRGSTTTAAS